MDDATNIASFALFLLLFGLVPANTTAAPPPVITAQPLDQSVSLGGTATFTVTATSGTALSYQWYKDGLLNLDTKLTGQTASTLTINNVGLLDPGTFYVEVKNAGGTVESRHASLNIVLINNAPVAYNDSYTTSEDVSLNVSAPGIIANDTDADGNSLTAVLVTNPTHGNVNLNANGHFVYLPNTNYNGSDSFTYAAHDGTVAGNVATVTINITPVNDPPIAVNDSVSVAEDGSVEVRVLDNDNDPEGNSLTVISASTTNGTAIVNNNGNGGRVQFTPSPNFYGTVVFSYVVSDGSASSTGSVTVTVTHVSHAPVANNDAYTVSEDVTLTVPLAGLLSTGSPGVGILANDTDVDGDTLTAVLVSNVSHGSLTLNANGSFTYTPTSNYNGPDSFTYRASDGSSTGNIATVTITVTPVNDPATITSQRMTLAGFELHVSGIDSTSCVIWASTNLRDWTPISTNAPSAGTLVFTDTAAANHASRYYRIESR